jgi:hypothetical protein
MKVTHGVKKKLKEKKEFFEKKQAEAFRQFMKSHLTDPLFQECVMKLYF